MIPTYHDANRAPVEESVTIALYMGIFGRSGGRSSVFPTYKLRLAKRGFPTFSTTYVDMEHYTCLQNDSLQIILSLLLENIAKSSSAKPCLWGRTHKKRTLVAGSKAKK